MFTLLNGLLVKQDFKSTGHCIQAMEVASPITPFLKKKKEKEKKDKNYLLIRKRQIPVQKLDRLKQPAETEHQKIWEWKMI